MNNVLEFVKTIATDDILTNLHKRKESLLLSISPEYKYSREKNGIVGIYDIKTQEILDEIDHLIEQRQFKLERVHFVKN
jgi:predicted rRNA methylase YqxC with S4 and FtsJ domains